MKKEKPLSKRKSLVWPVMLFLVIILSLAVSACGGDKSTPATTSVAPSVSTSTSPAAPQPAAPTSSAAAQTTTASSKPSPAAQTSAASGSGLSALLSKSANVAMKYDMVTSMSVSGAATEMSSTVWLKGSKMKSDSTVSGMQTITFINTADQTAIAYLPAQGIAMKTSLAQAGVSKEQSDVSSIMQYSPAEAGTETLDGKLCTIVTYTTSAGATKMWLWQEKGLPLKVEQDTPQGKAVITFKNYNFSAIADSEFELPAGVQITDMGSIKIPTQP